MPTTTTVRERPRCRVPECRGQLVYKTKQLCRRHYMRLWRTGEVGDAEPQRARWAGDDISYLGMHLRLVRRFGPASEYPCFEGCGRAGREWSYDHGDPHERYHPRGYPYSTDPDRYQPLCSQCHRRLDSGR